MRGSRSSVLGELRGGFKGTISCHEQGKIVRIQLTFDCRVFRDQWFAWPIHIHGFFEFLEVDYAVLENWLSERIEGRKGSARTVKSSAPGTSVLHPSHIHRRCSSSTGTPSYLLYTLNLEGTNNEAIADWAMFKTIIQRDVTFFKPNQRCSNEHHAPSPF